jgi:hypothetical protein
MTPNEINTLLLGALIGVFATSLTTLISHLFQLVRDNRERKWRSEQEIRNRWWERKVTAYENIINSLVDLTNSLDKWSSREYEDTSGDREHRIGKINVDEQRKVFWETIGKLEKTAIEGAYIISRQATIALEELMKKLTFDDGEEYFFMTLGNNLFAAKECLQIMRDEARKDLEIK